MEGSSSDPFLGDLRVCGTGCGLADEKNKAADSQARAASSKKLSIAIVLCVIFIAVELAGGLIANSLAILTDAAHLLSDVAGFAISLFAIWASSWEATPRQSYGYFRLEILGALLSIQLIWLLTGIIVYEAIYRITHTSQAIDGRLMFLVATFGFCVNLVMVFLLGHHGHSHGHSHGHGYDHAHSHGHGYDHVHSHGHGHGHGHNLHGNEHDHSFGYDENLHGNEHDHPHEHRHAESQGPQFCVDDHNHSPSHDHHHLQDIEKDEHDQQGSPRSHGVFEGLTQMHNMERKNSFTVDIDTSKLKGSNAGDINIKGAWLHVLGDLIQSVGVMVGGAVIWVKPEWKIVDLICTLLFSVLVLATTVRILRDTMEILMESTPREIDAKKLEKGLCEIPGVIAIHELHIWAITLGKTLLACHVTIVRDADADDILQKVIDYCEKVFSISHVTIQIERQRGNSQLD